MKTANVTTSEGAEKEDAVDALLEVPRRLTPESPKLGCGPVELNNDASWQANSSGKQMPDGYKLAREITVTSTGFGNLRSEPSNVEALPEKAGGRDSIEGAGAEKPAGPSVTLDLDAISRELVWGLVVSIPHKDWKPAEERGSVLGSIDVHEGLGPHTHQGRAQCMEHHFHEWPCEGQESPQYVGKGPNLMSRQGASLWVLGRYLLDGTYHWYDRYCVWA